MSNKPINGQLSKELLIELLKLTAFLVLIEISFFFQCTRAYLSDYEFMSKYLTLPWSIYPEIIIFVLAQCLVHLGYTIIIWLLALGLLSLHPVNNKQFFQVGMSLWLAGVIACLAGNEYLYPNSKFAELCYCFFHGTFAKFIAYSGLVFFSLLSCWLSLRLFFKMTLTSLLIIATAFAYFHSSNDTIITSAGNVNKPNIIIIGIDSLRPDYLSYFGNNNLATPEIDAFLAKSSVFTEALTPLARTFPSWISILTGEHPRDSGIRTNLTLLSKAKLANTLPMVLKQHGYQTLYATDESRFSNIDGTYGFDEVVTPPIGLSDFLLGSFNDFPLSNLLINTRLGSFLFPHSYANRPVAFAYDPDTFLRKLEPVINKQHNKPLFFAIHFCLPHHPYVWARLPYKQYAPVDRYAQSIPRVDQQLHDFLGMLKTAHLLDHAIVILLSDHGEALELPGDRVTEARLYQDKFSRKPPMFYPPPVDSMSINQTVGHGTDALSLNQYHTLLAFRLYGLGDQKPTTIPGTVSLMDIRPSLLGYLDNNIKQPNSLMPIVQHGSIKRLPARHIFIETDFTPEAIRTVYPNLRDVVLEGIQLFRIDPISGRLYVRDNMQKMIIRSKQYADIYDDWILAIYPQIGGKQVPVLVNLVTGKWTTDLSSPLAKQSPAQEMLKAIRQFYGDEIRTLKQMT